MNILDYNFARMYFWYKKKRKKFDHKKLIFAAQNGMAGISAFISLEVMIAFSILLEVDTKDDPIEFWGLLLAAIPIFGFLFYYSNEDKAKILANNYLKGRSKN